MHPVRPLLLSGALAILSFSPSFPAKAYQQPGAPQGPGQGAMMMRMHDIDSDGFISPAEHRTWAAHVFDMMDRNRDRRLDREEYMAVRMGDRRQGGVPGRMEQQAQNRKLERFRALDADRDGFVTRTQFLRDVDRRFGSLDANRDGKVSMDEFWRGHRWW